MVNFVSRLFAGSMPVPTKNNSDNRNCCLSKVTVRAASSSAPAVEFNSLFRVSYPGCEIDLKSLLCIDQGATNKDVKKLSNALKKDIAKGVVPGRHVAVKALINVNGNLRSYSRRISMNGIFLLAADRNLFVRRLNDEDFVRKLSDGVHFDFYDNPKHNVTENTLHCIARGNNQDWGANFVEFAQRYPAQLYEENSSGETAIKVFLDRIGYTENKSSFDQVLNYSASSFEVGDVSNTKSNEELNKEIVDRLEEDLGEKLSRLGEEKGFNDEVLRQIGIILYLDEIEKLKADDIDIDKKLPSELMITGGKLMSPNMAYLQAIFQNNKSAVHLYLGLYEEFLTMLERCTQGESEYFFDRDLGKKLGLLLTTLVTYGACNALGGGIIPTALIVGSTKKLYRFIVGYQINAGVHALGDVNKLIGRGEVHRAAQVMALQVVKMIHITETLKKSNAKRFVNDQKTLKNKMAFGAEPAKWPAWLSASFGAGFPVGVNKIRGRMMARPLMYSSVSKLTNNWQINPLQKISAMFSDVGLMGVTGEKLAAAYLSFTSASEKLPGETLKSFANRVEAMYPRVAQSYDINERFIEVRDIQNECYKLDETGQLNSLGKMFVYLEDVVKRLYVINSSDAYSYEIEKSDQQKELTSRKLRSLKKQKDVSCTQDKCFIDVSSSFMSIMNTLFDSGSEQNLFVSQKYLSLRVESLSQILKNDIVGSNAVGYGGFLILEIWAEASKKMISSSTVTLTSGSHFQIKDPVSTRSSVEIIGVDNKSLYRSDVAALKQSLGVLVAILKNIRNNGGFPAQDGSPIAKYFDAANTIVKRCLKHLYIPLVDYRLSRGKNNVHGGKRVYNHSAAIAHKMDGNFVCFAMMGVDAYIVYNELSKLSIFSSLAQSLEEGVPPEDLDKEMGEAVNKLVEVFGWDVNHFTGSE